MYNTLKEIQEGLSHADLNKYANESIGKTAEEIIEILKKDNVEISLEAAKECVQFLKDIDVISDEELDNVAGGTCYSKGDGVAAPNGEIHNYVITTVSNTCPGATMIYNSEFGYYQKSTCSWCSHHFGNVPMYCDARWVNHETLAPGFDENDRECCDNMNPFIDGPKNW